MNEILSACDSLLHLGLEGRGWYWYVSSNMNVGAGKEDAQCPAASGRDGGVAPVALLEFRRCAYDGDCGKLKCEKGMCDIMGEPAFTSEPFIVDIKDI